jgi:hypothetical protein
LAFGKRKKHTILVPEKAEYAESICLNVSVEEHRYLYSSMNENAPPISTFELRGAAELHSA